MNFITYDIIFLVVFVLFVSIFLYTRKSNLKRDGLLYLYRTRLGMKLIDYVGGRYQKSLKFLSYVSIGMGYILMISMFYLFYTILKIYIFRPDIVSMIKVPPITPLVPYIDKIVPGLPSFFFTYWIIILAVIAITHEFSHGIFMKRYGIKIKSTGFGFFPFFLPIFLAAFVEQDEKSMVKKGNFEQMAVLSAGTFANILTAIFFFGVLLLFFSFAFTPSGLIFDDYSYSIVETISISAINGVILTNPTPEKIIEEANKTNINEILADGQSYVRLKGFSNDGEYVALYNDLPAIKVGLKGAITQINNERMISLENLQNELMKYSPGEEIEITTTQGVFKIVLAENPLEENSPQLGIGFSNSQRTGVVGSVVNVLGSFKKPHVEYKSKFESSEFIYDLLWWLILISVSVALVNMLPVGIFDGGRFFYLTILSLTKSKKIAKKSFKASTYFFLFMLLVLMVFWAISFL